MRIDDSLINALMDENVAVFLRITDFGTVGAEDSPLWLNKPEFPQIIDIRKLADYVSYDVLLYRFTQVQRGIRLKKSWCRYVETECVARRGGSSFNVPKMFPPADDSLVGVYSEGMTIADLLWFTLLTVVGRVPVFFVTHLSDSEVQLLPPTQRSISNDDVSFVQLYGRDRNSSREQAYFETRGYIESEESVRAYAHHRGEAIFDNYFVLRREQFFPTPLALLDMGAQHFPCILPPLPPRSALDPRWIANPHPEAYYDWEHGRIIHPTYAGDFTLPSGYLAHVPTYGFPAPAWRFYEYDAGGLHQLSYLEITSPVGSGCGAQIWMDRQPQPVSQHGFSGQP
ncbi:hypothetical protein BDZ89DRAFT_1049736 [Hymenopellis radicata]|nr:hypothetical protein BDZ89DRAFT_1049736 [Hymenopellis radicata]